MPGVIFSLLLLGKCVVSLGIAHVGNVSQTFNKGASGIFRGCLAISGLSRTQKIQVPGHVRSNLKWPGTRVDLGKPVPGPAGEQHRRAVSFCARVYVVHKKNIVQTEYQGLCFSETSIYVYPRRSGATSPLGWRQARRVRKSNAARLCLLTFCAV